MIAYLEGKVLSKTDDSAIILAGGVGYRVNLAAATCEQLARNASVCLYITESISPYDGTALYGFRTPEDQQLFDLFREAIPKTGAKKALEYLNKALKSLPDFRNAIIKHDTRLLTGIFGFTANTAQKIIDFLKDKAEQLPSDGEAKMLLADGQTQTAPVLGQVLAALIALGYSNSEAARAIAELSGEGFDAKEPVESLVRRALRRLVK